MILKGRMDIRLSEVPGVAGFGKQTKIRQPEPSNQISFQ